MTVISLDQAAGWQLSLCAAAVALATLPQPAQARRVEVLLDPGRVVLGEGPTDVTVTVTVTDTHGRAAADADVVLHATAGTVSPAEELGPGRFAARLVRPENTFPQLAVVIAADLAEMAIGEPPVVGSAAIAYAAKVMLNGRTEPRARMSVRIGRRIWGPVLADSTGQFSLGIVVEPGESFAEGISADELGNTSRSKINLFLPEVQRLHGFVFPEELIADGDDRGHLFVATLSATGAPEDAPITARAERGRLAAPVRVGRGMVRLAYQAPAGLGDGRDRMVIEHTRRRSHSSLEMRLSSGAPVAARLRVEPDPIPADARSLGIVDVEVLDRAGNSSQGHEVRLTADGEAVALQQTAAGWRGTLPPRAALGAASLQLAVTPRVAGCRRSRLVRGMEGWAVVDRRGVGCAGTIRLVRPGVGVVVEHQLGANGGLPDAGGIWRQLEAGLQLEVEGGVPRRVATRLEALSGRGVELAATILAEKVVQWRPAGSIELRLVELERQAGVVVVRLEARGLTELGERVRLESPGNTVAVVAAEPLALVARVSFRALPATVIAVDKPSGVATWLRIE